MDKEVNNGKSIDTFFYIVLWGAQLASSIDRGDSGKGKYKMIFK